MRGISCASKRHSKANNKYCPDYDKTKPEKWIVYIDINKLYGKAMSQYLPYGGFKWVKVNNKVVNRILNRSAYSLYGYFLEGDLDYPEELHDSHKDFPMAPEKIKVKKEMLSLYSRKNAKKFDIKTANINTLVPNVMAKEKHVVHYRNLQYYLSEGLVLKKVHRILEFKQGDWVKSYIDFNTESRKKATNEADKNLFKLWNNAVYGKIMENLRKRIKIRITKTPKDFLKYASRPTYIGHNIFSENLVVIYENKELLILNKPIYVACTLLELSKL